jgi:glycosyltransferase involved in cell wall biosynthesis
MYKELTSLSVILCTYNRAGFLKQALESLDKQTLSKNDFEIILIDDGSSDNTREIVESFRTVLPIKYFYQKNAGLASARNHGIFAAQGHILLFLDDDDLATPTLLEEHIKTHKKYHKENYAVLHYTSWAPYLQVTPLMHFITEIGCFLFAYPYIKHGDILGYKNFWGGRISCKRSFLLNYGNFNPVFKFGNEDTELGYRLSKHNLKVVYNAHAVAYMIRPIDFEGFCQRLMKQGRANFICSQLHPNREVQEWCEVWGVAEKWQKLQLHYEALIKTARDLDNIANLKIRYGFGLDKTTKRLLNQAYLQAFQSCKIKGIMEEREKRACTYNKVKSESVTISDADKKYFNIVAIICAYNEGDIIHHVLKHLIENEISVYLLDHNSTDDTIEVASQWLGKGLIHIEKFPQESGFPEDLVNKFALRAITQRVEQLHNELGADWYMHYDADEFRESPWPGMNLKEAIQLIDSLGYNAVDFEVLNFRPTDNSYIPKDDVRKYLRYFEPAEEFDKMQVKAWKNFGQMIDLSTTGGHMVSFSGRKIFPVKFITLHFPIRSQEHGLRKILKDRSHRFDKKEKALGWHIQYSTFLDNDKQPSFIYEKDKLTLYNLDKMRAKLWVKAIIKLDPTIRE